MVDRRNSIIRRAIPLMIGVGAGLTLNFMLVYLASHFMSTSAFGLLHLGITVTNVAFAPAPVLSLILSGHLAETLATRGREATALAARGYERYVIAVSVAGTALATMFVLVCGWIGVSWSTILVFGVTFAIAASYAAESRRAVFQGFLAFNRVAVYSFVWMAARFAAGLAAIVLTGMPGVAMAAIAAATIAVYALFPNTGGMRQLPIDGPTGQILPSISRLIPFILAYFIVNGIAFSDQVIAYLVLSQYDFGRYAASSVLPKAIALAALPLVQVTYPVIRDMLATGASHRASSAKGIAGTVALAVVAVLVLTLFKDNLCGGSIGIAGCDTAIMPELAVAAGLLSLVRIIAVTRFVHGRFFDVVALAAVAAAALLIPFNWEIVSPRSLARAFFWFALVLTTAYALLCSCGYVFGRLTNRREDPGPQSDRPGAA